MTRAPPASLPGSNDRWSAERSDSSTFAVAPQRGEAAQLAQCLPWRPAAAVPRAGEGAYCSVARTTSGRWRSGVSLALDARWRGAWQDSSSLRDLAAEVVNLGNCRSDDCRLAKSESPVDPHGRLQQLLNADSARTREHLAHLASTRRLGGACLTVTHGPRVLSF
jgi:hypothetical protein